MRHTEDILSGNRAFQLDGGWWHRIGDRHTHPGDRRPVWCRPSSLFQFPFPVLYLCLFLCRPHQGGLGRHLVAWFFLPSYCLIFTKVFRICAGDPALATPCSSLFTESSFGGEGCRGKDLLHISAVTRPALDRVILLPYTVKNFRNLSAVSTTIFIYWHLHLLILLQPCMLQQTTSSVMRSLVRVLLFKPSICLYPSHIPV
jgi:hypothetical protein